MCPNTIQRKCLYNAVSFLSSFKSSVNFGKSVRNQQVYWSNYSFIWQIFIECLHILCKIKSNGIKWITQSPALKKLKSKPTHSFIHSFTLRLSRSVKFGLVLVFIMPTIKHLWKERSSLYLWIGSGLFLLQCFPHSNFLVLN